MPSKDPLHIRARDHVLRTAGTCNEFCRRWRMYDRLLPSAFLFGVLCFLLYYVTIAPPITFPSAALIKVNQNESIDTVAAQLKERHLIHSVFLFELSARLFGARKTIVAGEYFFAGPENVVIIGRRLARGDYELVPVRVTIPEGSNSSQMTDLLSQKVPDFDTVAFLAGAHSKEGYLFPDTYFFLPGEDPAVVLQTLEKNFEDHIAQPDVANALAQFDKQLSDVVTMASLVEKEAATLKDRRVIAGILWHRIALGMPLQVDAVFPYIIGKNSLQLTHADLKTESPYNTYTNKGLPPGPIDNPSIDSILAAATPIKTNYLYYLSDLNGNFHYCATYSCQAANQKKYLK